MLIPTFYIFQGAKITDPIVVVSGAYYVFVALFCEPIRPLRCVLILYCGRQGSSNGFPASTATKGVCSTLPDSLTGATKSWSSPVVNFVSSVSAGSADSSFEGSSGVGELLANTLAVKSVTVVVLDVEPIQTQNCMFFHYDGVLLS